MPPFRKDCEKPVAAHWPIGRLEGLLQVLDRLQGRVCARFCEHRPWSLHATYKQVCSTCILPFPYFRLPASKGLWAGRRCASVAPPYVRSRSRCWLCYREENLAASTHLGHVPRKGRQGADS